MIPYGALRPALFALPPESAHDAALAALEARKTLCGVSQPQRICSRTVMGLDFPNPIGLAAGFDKNAAHADALGALGFGFIEVGGITPRPQGGNSTPRIFRLPEAEALINRMGFNNCGAERAAENLSGRKWTGIVGVNLGKNAETPLEDAAADYCAGLESTYGVADFFTVNVSSPNTERLRELQRPGNLRELIRVVSRKRDALADGLGRRAPLLVKFSPDLADGELRSAALESAEAGADGAVAANTTLGRPGLAGSLRGGEELGGLSGRPLLGRAVEMIGILREALPEEAALIGVGGIFSASDARAHFRAGADLAQIYTGLIYRGPNLVREILNDFAAEGMTEDRRGKTAPVGG